MNVTIFIDSTDVAAHKRAVEVAELMCSGFSCASTILPRPTNLRPAETLDTFIFPLNNRVLLTESGEMGTVIARAEYINKVNTYLVRYRAGDGRQVESWWDEDAITPPPK